MENKKKNSKIRQLIFNLKSYLSAESDYYQVVLVEKITKIISIFILGILLSVLFLGLFFFLLFLLAYFLIPIVGEIISFSIAGGLLILTICLVILFQRTIVVNPVLRLIVKTIDSNISKTKKEEQDETN